MTQSKQMPRPALTLMINDHPTGTGPADPGLDALMRRAVTEIRACHEAIRETGPAVPAELKTYANKLETLIERIDEAAGILTIIALGPNPGKPHTRTRHLQPVGDDTA